MILLLVICLFHQIISYHNTDIYYKTYVIQNDVLLKESDESSSDSLVNDCIFVVILMNLFLLVMFSKLNMSVIVHVVITY